MKQHSKRPNICFLSIKLSSRKVFRTAIEEGTTLRINHTIIIYKLRVSKIADFDLCEIFRNEDIFWLNIQVCDSSFMTFSNSQTYQLKNPQSVRQRGSFIFFDQCHQ